MTDEQVVRVRAIELALAVRSEGVVGTAGDVDSAIKDAEKLKAFING